MSETRIISCPEFECIRILGVWNLNRESDDDFMKFFLDQVVLIQNLFLNLCGLSCDRGLKHKMDPVLTLQQGLSSSSTFYNKTSGHNPG